MNALLLPQYGPRRGKFRSKLVPWRRAIGKSDVERKRMVYSPVTCGPVRSWDGFVRRRAGTDRSL